MEMDKIKIEDDNYNFFTYKKDLFKDLINKKPCDICSNNPAVNPLASGICHCTLGAMQIT